MINASSVRDRARLPLQPRRERHLCVHPVLQADHVAQLVLHE